MFIARRGIDTHCGGDCARSRVGQRQAVEIRFLAGGPVQIQQSPPGGRVAMPAASRADQIAQSAFTATEVGIGEGDGSLIQFSVVLDFIKLIAARG